MDRFVNPERVVMMSIQPPHVYNPEFIIDEETHGWRVKIILDVVVDNTLIVEYYNADDEEQCKKFIKQFGFLKF
jgi:hypothetical protein